MSSNQTKRHFHRISFDAKTRIISVDSSKQWPSHLIDISLNGVLVSRPENWSANNGDEFKLEFQLGSKTDDQYCLNMNVNVAHMENDHVGFHINQMDLDTATHLHRLVELNLGDTSMLKREFAELIKQHNK